MNVKNNINWDLIKYSAVISSFIFFNYLLWALNTITFIKMINFFILVIIFIFFFISKKYNHLWYLKIVILLLLLISLGIPTIANDSRQIYLFSGKILFYESNFYNFLEHSHNYLFFQEELHNYCMIARILDLFLSTINSLSLNSEKLGSTVFIKAKGYGSLINTLPIFISL